MDDRGTATVEYLVILLGVTLLCSVATVTLGPLLLQSFSAQVTWILLPF